MNEETKDKPLDEDDMPNRHQIALTILCALAGWTVSKMIKKAYLNMYENMHEDELEEETDQ